MALQVMLTAFRCHTLFNVASTMSAMVLQVLTLMVCLALEFARILTDRQK